MRDDLFIQPWLSLRPATRTHTHKLHQQLNEINDQQPIMSCTPKSGPAIFLNLRQTFDVAAFSPLASLRCFLYRRLLFELGKGTREKGRSCWENK